MPQCEFIIQTNGPGLYEFTAQVCKQVEHWAGQAAPAEASTHATGLLTLFVRHTSCSLLIQENADPDVCHDLEAYFRRLVPSGDDPSMAWLTHVLEGPDDMPAHIRAALLPVSLSIPVADGRPLLGTWQGIYLFEHRDASHQRRVVAHLG